MPLIPFEDALDLALAQVARLGVEDAPTEAAAGRWLAESIAAGSDMPAFSYSAMDGYAAASTSFADDGPWTLPVKGESRAGAGLAALAQGAACRIFTGAPIPAGADCVLMQEHVTRHGERLLVPAARKPEAGQWIRRRGADLTRGAVALAEGERLTPGKIALAAALDRPALRVARRPRVVAVSTGDELRRPGEPGAPESIASAQIPESNGYAVAAIAENNGAVASRSLAPDDPDKLEAALGFAIMRADLVVTVGGAAGGDHDLVRAAFERLGARFDFWGVAMKPGKPTAVGAAARGPAARERRLRGRAKLLCLPGNPASATLAFLLFGVPILRAMQGDREPKPRRALMTVVGDFERASREHAPGRIEFLRARLEHRSAGAVAVLCDNQASGAVTSFATADALVVLPGEIGAARDGDRLEVIALGDLWG